MVAGMLSASDDLLDRLPIARGSSVADVGFGNPAELTALATIVGEAGFVFGVERSSSRAGKMGSALSLPNVRVMTGDASRLPLSDESVDLVLFKGVLHEIRDIGFALFEAKRICKNCGTIGIVDFSSFPRAWLKRSNLHYRLRHPWRVFEPPPDLHAGFSREEIGRLLEKIGLREERYQDNFARGRFYSHPVPMFLATATVEKGLEETEEIKAGSRNPFPVS